MISVRNASKRFLIHHQRATELKERIVGRLKGRRFDTEEFWALRHVDLTVREGESVALIGANGSGKSTLLQLVAKILVPDTGTVTVNGRVSALLELGAGFNPELTGRENVYLASAIQGFGKREVQRRMRDIIDFAELERFIDTPIKNYSTGMYMRLGFSVATHVDPDILLIDEILAVGDEAFQQKCIRRIEEFKNRGKTIVFVSHSMDAVRLICDRAVLLDKGRLALDGAPDETIRHYFGILGLPAYPQQAAEPAAPSEPAEVAPTMAVEPVVAPGTTVYLEILQGGVAQTVMARVVPAPVMPEATAAPPDSGAPQVPLPDGLGPPAPRRYGMGLVRITAVDIAVDDVGEDAASHRPVRVTARIHYHAECIVRRPVFGVAIHAEDGAHLLGPNTKDHGLEFPAVEGDGIIEWTVTELPLQPGRYLFTAAIFNHAIDVVYDFCDRMYPFEVSGSPGRDQGHLAVESRFHVPDAARAAPLALPTSKALSGRE